MKLRPSQRNIRRQSIDAVKARIDRWKGVKGRMTPGFLPYEKACAELERAESELKYLKENPLAMF